ncbi:MAG: DUF1638 domain-containing protein [Kiritimatiellae bacterium]|nr:DUF1638 domain-containing protein [Kiritimatiellia bacterium]
MKLKCLACESLARPVYLCAAQSPHVVDVTLFRIGLHRDPPDLHRRLQEQIDAAGAAYDAVAMAYGLCGQATLALTAREVPLVIPRAHDCITLFLGGRETYRTQTDRCPGTYWYVLDYIERTGGNTTALSLGTSAECDMPGVYEQYVAKYGKENADYLMEVMGAWLQHYERAAFVDMGVGNPQVAEQQARDAAGRRGWRFERIEGDLLLIRRLLDGDWQDDFLVLKPGEFVRASHDDRVLKPGRES